MLHSGANPTRMRSGSGRGIVARAAAGPALERAGESRGVGKAEAIGGPLGAHPVAADIAKGEPAAEAAEHMLERGPPLLQSPVQSRAPPPHRAGHGIDSRLSG